jgi:phosphoglycerol geranylgeranyltransferase
MRAIEQQLRSARQAGRCLFAVLLDPDRFQPEQAERFAKQAEEAGVDLILLGGSLLLKDQLDTCLQQLRRYSQLPITLFPGSPLQLSPLADAVLLLSLLSGRNPDFLIGHHVLAAPYLKRSGLEIIPTAYLLIDGGVPTSVSYMSGTTPIPADKPDIAVCTAMAGEQLGLRCLYLDAGSGAQNPVPADTIAAIRQAIDLPIIVGGGIRSPEQARARAAAGANLVVVGNALESGSPQLGDWADAVHRP